MCAAIYVIKNLKTKEIITNDFMITDTMLLYWKGENAFEIPNSIKNVIINEQYNQPTEIPNTICLFQFGTWYNQETQIPNNINNIQLQIQ